MVTREGRRDVEGLGLRPASPLMRNEIENARTLPRNGEKSPVKNFSSSPSTLSLSGEWDNWQWYY